MAAIVEKLANASFEAALKRPLDNCIALFTLMAGDFVRPVLASEPGLAQMPAAFLASLPALPFIGS